MTNLLWIAFGGALGAVSRYGLSRYFISSYGINAAPWATLATNVVGSLLIGIAYVILVERQQLPVHLTQAITVGILGAFTTFSTFSLDIFHFISAGRYWFAISYLLLSIILGLTAVTLGIILARLS